MDLVIARYFQEDLASETQQRTSSINVQGKFEQDMISPTSSYLNALRADFQRRGI